MLNEYSLESAYEKKTFLNSINAASDLLLWVFILFFSTIVDFISNISLTLVADVEALVNVTINWAKTIKARRIWVI